MAHPAPSESVDPTSEGAGTAATGGARAPVALTALTLHDDFLLELGQVLGGRASVHPAESIDAALDQLGADRGGQILAIDARENADVRADVERAGEATPHAVILVFTGTGAEKTVATVVKGTKVFAVLPLPMEPDKTSAVLDAAITDALQQSARAHGTRTRPSPHDALGPRRPPSDAPATTAPEPRSGSPRRGLWLTIGAGVLALAVGAVAFLMTRHPAARSPAATRRPTPPAHAVPNSEPAPPPGPAVDTSIVQGRVEDLLEKASRAMFARRFTAPKGANAMVYYRSVLAVDPTNGEARDGLRRVSHVLISRFQNDITQGHDNAAALALATLRLAEPTDPHIRPFGIELSDALVNQALSSGQLNTVPALIAQAARRGVPAAQITAWQSALSNLQQQTQIQGITQQIVRRIRANRLIGAASAASALARLRTLAPSAPATQSATRALIGALLHQARQAGTAGHNAGEDRWLAAARSAGATTQALAAVRQQVTLSRAHAAQGRVAQLLAKARARLVAGALVRPDHDSTAYYLTLIGTDRPDPSEAAAAGRLRSALARALVAQTESAARAGQHATALADLAAARHWGASGAALHAAAALAATPPAPTAAQLAEVARHLHRTHYVAPEYPQRALSARIAGEVTVQYVVDKTGRTRALQVVSGRPAGEFNRAALDAIRRWRYAPPKFHGEPVSVPVRTMIRFVLPN